MTVIRTTHQCDWPGCCNSIDETCPGELSERGWESRCDGRYIVCDVHRWHSVEDRPFLQPRLEQSVYL